RVGADLDRDPRADGGLPRRRLARTRLEHLAHDHVLDLGRLEARALEARPDDDRAELGRLLRGERAAELPERSADCGDDDRPTLCHPASLANPASVPCRRCAPSVKVAATGTCPGCMRRKGGYR